MKRCKRRSAEERKRLKVDEQPALLWDEFTYTRLDKRNAEKDRDANS